jgi:hypothetical protein
MLKTVAKDFPGDGFAMALGVVAAFVISTLFY